MKNLGIKILALVICFGVSSESNALSAVGGGKAAFEKAKGEITAVVKRNMGKLPAIVAAKDDKLDQYAKEDKSKVSAFCSAGCNRIACGAKSAAAVLCYALCPPKRVNACMKKAEGKFPNTMKKMRSADAAVAKVKSVLGL